RDRSFQAGRRAAVTVERGDLLGVDDLTLLVDVAGEELRQLFHALGFGAEVQQRLAEVEIRDGLRQLEAELDVVELGFEDDGIRLDGAELLESFESLVADLAGR